MARARDGLLLQAATVGGAEHAAKEGVVELGEEIGIALGEEGVGQVVDGEGIEMKSIPKEG